MLSLGGSSIASCWRPPVEKQTPFITSPPGEIRHDEFESGGLKRTYITYIPKAFKKGASKLLIVLHGAGGEGADMRGIGIEHWADRLGALVVYPDAVGGDARRTWALGCSHCTWADEQRIDDFRFMEELLRKLTDQYSLDRSRVFISGASLGGSFAFDFACRSSDLIAGVAVIASLPSPEELSQCKNGPPISVMILNGDRDPNIPWEGGGRYGYLSNADAARFWATRNDCPTSPSVTKRATENDRGRDVIVSEYSPCRKNSFVSLYRLAGGGHEWPRENIDAAKEIVDRFLAGY